MFKLCHSSRIRLMVALGAVAVLALGCSTNASPAGSGSTTAAGQSTGSGSGGQPSGSTGGSSGAGSNSTSAGSSGGSASGVGSSGAPATSGGTITLGFMGDFTGSQSYLGPDMLTGVKTAMAYINANGGVLGKQLKVVTGDSVGDPVDAVPAFRKIVSVNHIVAEIGPTSNSGPALIPIASAAHIPIFLQGGTTALDHDTDPFFFRTTVGDGVEGKAMAYFAISKGWKSAAFAFTSSAAAQTLVAPIQSAFTKHGGHTVLNVQLTPDTSSYRAEILQIVNAHPDVVFFQQDPQTAGTFFKEVNELGYLKSTNWIGTDTETSQDVFKAVGAQTAQDFWMTLGGTETSPALDTFNTWYKKVTGKDQPLTFAPEDWDATTLLALAITKAGSVDGPAIDKAVTEVSSPHPGAVKVYNYVDGVAALKAGKEINYDGVASTDDFDQWHNVAGPFEVLRWSSGGKLTQITTISSATLGSY